MKELEDDLEKVRSLAYTISITSPGDYNNYLSFRYVGQRVRFTPFLSGYSLLYLAVCFLLGTYVVSYFSAFLICILLLIFDAVMLSTRCSFPIYFHRLMRLIVGNKISSSLFISRLNKW